MTQQSLQRLKVKPGMKGQAWNSALQRLSELNGRLCLKWGRSQHLYQGKVSSGREKRKQSPVRPLLEAQRVEPRSCGEVFRGRAMLL